MGVRFTSTRDRSVDVDFRSAIVEGQPPDGGLFIPVEMPIIDLDRLSALGAGSGSSFPRIDLDDPSPSFPRKRESKPGRGNVTSLDPDAASPESFRDMPRQSSRRDDLEGAVPALARTILSPWIGEDLAEILDWESIFPFPIKRVTLAGGSDFDGMTVVELFHGPTGSFKDFGARFLAACLKSVNRRSGRPAVVLVATSGDTGSAVADAFSSMPGVGVAILYPNRRVSPVQEAQLTRAREGVWAFAIDGSFDDCQKSVKHILATGIPEVDVISANSINVGRLLPQMLFYVSEGTSRESAPTFVVPCGNLGNLTAGLLVRSCATPGARFVAATNANDYFTRVLEHPEVDKVDKVNKVKPLPLKGTLSNAMDVANPSNLERINALYGREGRSNFLSAYAVDDEQTVDMMGRIFEETGYIADPHTSVALAAAARHRANQGDIQTDSWSVIATADPAKYKPLVESITGAEVDGARFPIPADPPHAVIGPEEVSQAVNWVASQIT
ncbi:MAG: threonine synthase [Rhodothermia bacterium]